MLRMFQVVSVLDGNYYFNGVHSFMFHGSLLLCYFRFQLYLLSIVTHFCVYLVFMYQLIATCMGVGLVSSLEHKHFCKLVNFNLAASCRGRVNFLYPLGWAVMLNS